jgi:hypothetical protein
MKKKLSRFFFYHLLPALLVPGSIMVQAQVSKTAVPAKKTNIIILWVMILVTGMRVPTSMK